MNYRVIIFIISTIIGSGIFLLPGALSQIGISAIFGFGFISIIFICIGYFFSCDDSNSPIELVAKVFGFKMGFVLNWMYWILSWSTLIITINEMFYYLSINFPICNKYLIILKILLVFCLTILNSISMKQSVMIEIILTILKLIPLVGLPLSVFFCKFHQCNIPVWSFSLKEALIAMPIAVWSFVGIETGAIVGRKFTNKITKPTVIAITMIVIIYLLNIISISYFANFKIVSIVAYYDLAKNFFGCQGAFMFNIIISIICLSSLNSCLFSTGIVGYDGAKVNFMPKIFTFTNKNKAPYISMIFSAIGLLPLIIFCGNQSARSFVLNALNLAGNGLLIYYFTVTLAFAKKKQHILAYLITILLFGMIMYNFYDNIYSLYIMIAIILSSYPVYYFIHRNKIIEQ